MCRLLTIEEQDLELGRLVRLSRHLEAERAKLDSLAATFAEDVKRATKVHWYESEWKDVFSKIETARQAIDSLVDSLNFHRNYQRSQA